MQLTRYPMNEEAMTEDQGSLFPAGLAERTILRESERNLRARLP